MSERRWIPAAPFRSHLLHECASAAVPWNIAALDAGLPVGLVQQLLDVRPGRRVERIAPELAHRVLTIDASSLARLATTMVESRVARTYAHGLLRSGWQATLIAHRARISFSELGALLRGHTPSVTRLLELRLIALSTGPSPIM